jgi:RHS repeat-associated protein
VTKQSFDPKTGLAICTYTGGACNSTGTVASLGFTFDAIGNLKSRTDSNTGYTESFCYDNLNRLTRYAMDTVCPGSPTVGYDAVGNITSKSGVGTYHYPTPGSSSVRPHAVSSITGTVNGAVNPNYDYDANGNLTCVYTGGSCGGGVAVQTVSMTSFNMTSVIAKGGVSASLTYDSEHARIRQVSLVGGVTTTTDYLNDPASGAMSEKVAVGADAPTFTDYLVVDGKIVGQRQGAPLWGKVAWNQFTWKAPPATTAGSFFILDHLGSVAVVTDASGNVTQRLYYDAWGKERNANGTDIVCGSMVRTTSRGFTNQEQIPGACLVNLNARLYDPTIGKFLSADPIVGDPGIPNAFNRYAYVLNNPLSFTDPSGLCFLGCFWNSKEFRGIFAIAVAVVFQRYEWLPKIGQALGFTTSSAALAATVNGAILGGIAGGISGGTLKSVGLGVLQGGLFAQAGNFLEGADGLTILGSHDAAAFVAHGLVGGITSVAGGGNFGSGFLAGGFSSLADMSTFDTGDFIGNVVEHAVIGGFASVLGGGKFANGGVKNWGQSRYSPLLRMI